MITEAIILAGGLGTRLKTVTGDTPKCMVAVNGIPFINFVISYLKNEGIDRFIFSLGYKSEVIIEYLDSYFKDIQKIYVVENEPLGTGGAIKKACHAVRGQEVVIINGDTLFNISLAGLLTAHHSQNAHCTIALTGMYDFDRYGTVDIDANGILTAFNEKKFCRQGFINGGIYIINVSKFLLKQLPEKFSFEKDYLEAFFGEGIFTGSPFYNYFIDIGVPEDYEAFKQKLSGSPAITVKTPYGNGNGIFIETIGAFFELLD